MHKLLGLPEYAFLGFGLETTLATCEENTLLLGDEDRVGVDGLGYLRLGYGALIRSIGIFYVSLQEQQNTIIIHLFLKLIRPRTSDCFIRLLLLLPIADSEQAKFLAI